MLFPNVSGSLYNKPSSYLILSVIIPPLHRRWNGGILDSPRCLYVRLSVRLSTRFPELFEKTIGSFISYLAFTLMGWVSWSIFISVFLASCLALWLPNIWPKMGFPEFFEKTIGPIHFIPGIYFYGVSLLTPIHYCVPILIVGPLVAKYLAENGVIGSIHFIPGIYPYGVNLLTPIHIRVPILIFGPLSAKYLAENGVSGPFWKQYWLNSFHTWHLSLWGESLEPYTFSCSKPHFRPFGGQIFGRKWGFQNFLKTLLAQLISCLAFILMVWVSWPLYIFLFLASYSAALRWPNIWPKMRFPELFEKTIGSIHFFPDEFPPV